MTNFQTINSCTFDWCQGHGFDLSPLVGDGWSVDVDGTHARVHQARGRYLELGVWESWRAIDGSHHIEPPMIDARRGLVLETPGQREEFAIEFARLRALAERIESSDVITN